MYKLPAELHVGTEVCGASEKEDLHEWGRVADRQWNFVD